MPSERVSITLPGIIMEVAYRLCVKENGHPFGATTTKCTQVGSTLDLKLINVHLAFSAQTGRHQGTEMWRTLQTQNFRDLTKSNYPTW